MTNWKSHLNKKNINKQLFLALDVSGIFNKDTLSLYNEIKNVLNNQYPILWISSKNLQWSVAEFLSPFPVIKVKENLKLSSLSKLEIDCKNQFKKALQTQNVIGSINGNSKKTVTL